MGADRTVKNGRVKIGGKWYYPQQNHMPYDGRCDGFRFHFGTYPPPFDAVSLHSLAGAIDSDDDNAIMEGPHCVDGHYPWAWWVEEGRTIHDPVRYHQVGAVNGGSE